MAAVVVVRWCRFCLPGAARGDEALDRSRSASSSELACSSPPRLPNECALVTAVNFKRTLPSDLKEGGTSEDVPPASSARGAASAAAAKPTGDVGGTLVRGISSGGERGAVLGVVAGEGLRWRSET